MQVRKSDGSYEEYDRRKLMSIVQKTFKGGIDKC